MKSIQLLGEMGTTVVFTKSCCGLLRRLHSSLLQAVPYFISDGRSPGRMCTLLLRVPDTILFFFFFFPKELLRASEMSPSQSAAGSPCHGIPSVGGRASLCRWALRFPMLKFCPVWNQNLLLAACRSQGPFAACRS
jgi:hypothetical protein